MLLREPARPPFIREHRHAPWFAVGTVCFGAFMGQLDASVVTLGLYAARFAGHPAAGPGLTMALLAGAGILAAVAAAGARPPAASGQR
jgi:hypothetical protein